MKQHDSALAEKPRFRPQSERLMDQVREVLRYHHYAFRTEESYVKWILAFIRFNGKRHPKELGKEHIEGFLSDMALNKNYAASTQNLAMSAIVFLYKHVLDIPVTETIEAVRSKKPVRLPVVMSRDEVEAVLNHMFGETGLMGRLMYGAGLRLMEVIRLRVQDIDFGNRLLMVRDGKGGKDRSTLLPASLEQPVRVHLEKVRKIFDEDLASNNANVWLPTALAKKYPKAGNTWSWQYVFPAIRLSKDPRSGLIRRHHKDESCMQKAVRKAVIKTGITKRVTTHTFRHSFATHLLESGTNIRVVQKLMGHADMKTTEIYTHVLQQNLQAVISPLEHIKGLNPCQ